MTRPTRRLPPGISCPVLPLFGFDLIQQPVERPDGTGEYAASQHEERAFDGTHDRASLQHESGVAETTTAADGSSRRCAAVCIRLTQGQIGA